MQSYLSGINNHLCQVIGSMDHQGSFHVLWGPFALQVLTFQSCSNARTPACKTDIFPEDKEQSKIHGTIYYRPKARM